MENNFDLKKFLTENKLTSNSRLMKENVDYVAFAMQNIGDESTPVVLTHGFNRYDEKKYKTTLGKALAFIKKNADASAIENGDVTVDGGPGVARITIGDQEFDLEASNSKSLKEEVDYSNKDGALAFYDNEDIVGTYGVDDAIEFARELAMTHFDAGPQQDKFFNDFLQAYKESGYDKGEEI